MNKYRLINVELAREYLDRIDDNVEKTLLDLSLATVARKYVNPESHVLSADLDMRFVAEVFKEVFSDRELLSRILAGERPGAWE